MGAIKIIVDQQGQVVLQSDFDVGTTLLLLAKMQKEVIDQPIKLQAAPQLQMAPPGLVGRLGGRG